MRTLTIIALSLFIPLSVFASSVSGDYNEFSVVGLTSGDYWEGWIFDSSDDSLGDSVCGSYGSGGALSDFSVEDVGADFGALSAGDYTLVIGAGGGCGGGWEHNPDCGVGKTLSDCCTAYGGCPMDYTYGVSYEFTVEGESTSTPSSTVSTSTADASNQLFFLTFTLLDASVLALSIYGSYKLLCLI